MCLPIMCVRVYECVCVCMCACVCTCVCVCECLCTCAYHLSGLITLFIESSATTLKLRHTDIRNTYRLSPRKAKIWYCLFYRALLQKRPIRKAQSLVSSMLITYYFLTTHVTNHFMLFYILFLQTPDTYYLINFIFPQAHDICVLTSTW